MSGKKPRKGRFKMTEITYTQKGDYLFPNISTKEDGTDLPEIGMYGRMRRTYLKEHKKALYNELLRKDELFPHLREAEEAARNRLNELIPRMAKAQGVTEELKAKDPMRWVGLMNNIKHSAEETVFAELIYA
jgi:hypothetical protein